MREQFDCDVRERWAPFKSYAVEKTGFSNPSLFWGKEEIAFVKFCYGPETVLGTACALFYLSLHSNKGGPGAPFTLSVTGVSSLEVGSAVSLLLRTEALLRSARNCEKQEELNLIPGTLIKNALEMFIVKTTKAWFQDDLAAARRLVWVLRTSFLAPESTIHHGSRQPRTSTCSEEDLAILLATSSLTRPNTGWWESTQQRGCRLPFTTSSCIPCYLSNPLPPIFWGDETNMSSG
nr:PREDICTED: uncharacterized protein LOC103548132 [Equus przewalskii]